MKTQRKIKSTFGATKKMLLKKWIAQSKNTWYYRAGSLGTIGPIAPSKNRFYYRADSLGTIGPIAQCKIKDGSMGR